MKSHLIRTSKFLRFSTHRPPAFLNRLPGYVFALVAKSSAFIKESHLTALTRVLKFHFKRKNTTGSFFINFKLCSDLTRKAIGVRMGKGKGPLSGKIFFLRPGYLICFVSHSSVTHARYILLKCARRIPVSCRISMLGS